MPPKRIAKPEKLLQFRSQDKGKQHRHVDAAHVLYIYCQASPVFRTEQAAWIKVVRRMCSFYRAGDVSSNPSCCPQATKSNEAPAGFWMAARQRTEAGIYICRPLKECLLHVLEIMFQLRRSSGTSGE